MRSCSTPLSIKCYNIIDINGIVFDLEAASSSGTLIRTFYLV